MKKIFFSLITLTLSILLVFIGGEVMIRIFREPFVPNDERNLLYEYDKELGWFPKKNSSNKFTGSHLINVQHNEFGFRDVSHGNKKRPRIAFVGDSFVWGYDVEQKDRFTEKLQSKLTNREILNMGVSGYGTDQEFLLTKRWFDHFQPDIVFLVFYSKNDEIENSTNKEYGLYKPYFTIDKNEVQPQGIPVPLSINYYRKTYPVLFKSRLIDFLLNLTLQKKIQVENPTLKIIIEVSDFVKSKGAVFYLAFVDHAFQGTDQCSFCKEENIDHLFLTNQFKFEGFGKHWTPEGHNFVADRIFDFLAEREISNSLKKAN